MKKAEKIAKNFYYQRINTFKDIVSYSDIKVNNVFSEKNNEDIVYYIFNIDKGYVIVYADDNLNPVIGYSLNNEYDPYNLSDNYKSWMKSYVDEYNWVKENNITGDKEIKEQWDYLLNIDINSNISGKDSKEIEPLLRTTWNQGNITINIVLKIQQVMEVLHIQDVLQRQWDKLCIIMDILCRVQVQRVIISHLMVLFLLILVILITDGMKWKIM